MDDSKLPRTYPPGVPCWIDTAQQDVKDAARFYGGLLGWEFPESGPEGYLIATLEGAAVAAIRQAQVGGGGLETGAGPGWLTYLAVADAAAAADAVATAGGTAVGALAGTGPWARTVGCADPAGAVFGLWQPEDLPGAQRVNVAATWNFSHLHSTEPQQARAFYAAVFGWQYDDVPGGGASVRVPGYGDHLAATVDPGIRERQAGAPPGFADVVAGMQQATPGESAHWHVTFTVADRDTSAAAAERLGGTVLADSESPWAKLAEVRDPQGAQFTLSQFRMPG